MASLRYEHVNKQNTYAWITLTANSSPHSKMKIAKGTKVTKNTIIPLVNNLARRPERIFNKECPATKLANNRTPKEKALAIYEMNSIKTNIGTNAKGVPAGTKNEKKCNLCLAKPNNVTPIKIVTLRPKDTITDVPTAYW